MSKVIAILQSNYIPWKGYFELIHLADEFILYDDMQYTRRDWRNRNKIKTQAGIKWLTVAVDVKNRYYQRINQTRIAERAWAEKHWQKLQQAYRLAPFFADYRTMVEGWYEEVEGMTMLSEINYCLITKICKFLKIDTPITSSSDYHLINGKSERLIQLCLDAGGSCYLSGTSAKDYLDETAFNNNGISVKWMDYRGYPPYTQLFGDFEHGVSILDVIFNCGADARAFVIRE